MARLVSLHNFIETYGNEDTCWQHLRQARWGKDAFECPRCGETDDWNLIQPRKLFECYTCRYQCSITAGTILQDTKLDLSTWFLAARLVLTMKKGISSHELARQLDVSQETAWYLIQRLTCVVKRRYGRELFGLIEVDETYTGGQRSAEGQFHRPLIVGLVEAKDESAGNLVLSHVVDRSAASIDAEITDHIDQDESVVKTDGWKSYWGLAERTGYEHEMHKLGSRSDASEVLWVHLVFSNLKRVLKGVHTKASRGHLQGYLDVFTYRFNHRDDLEKGLEAGVVGLVSSKPVTRERLKAGLTGQVY